MPLALCCSVFLSNMSGDWIASKLIWVVLAVATASLHWTPAEQRISVVRPSGNILPVSARSGAF
jgi:hypothetical protein